MYYYPVAIAIGSNLGDKQANLIAAIKSINLTHCIVGDFYRTKALLPPGTEESWDIPFLNTAIAGYTHASPWQLLRICQNIEQSMGRPIHARTKWAPRIIDLDIIFYSRIVIKQGNLLQGLVHSYPNQNIDLDIPHPLFYQRDFVMQPLANIITDTWIQWGKDLLCT